MNRVKPPETRQVQAPWARIVRTSVVPPGVSVRWSAISPSIAPTGMSRNNATRSRRAGSNAISPRIARSVIAAT